MVLFVFLGQVNTKICFPKTSRRDQTKGFERNEKECKACKTFFVKKQVPKVANMPNNWLYICQYWKTKNMPRFATLFDTATKIPVYSAYKLNFKAEDTICSPDISKCSKPVKTGPSKPKKPKLDNDCDWKIEIDLEVSSAKVIEMGSVEDIKKYGVPAVVNNQAYTALYENSG